LEYELLSYYAVGKSEVGVKAARKRLLPSSGTVLEVAFVDRHLYATHRKWDFVKISTTKSIEAVVLLSNFTMKYEDLQSSPFKNHNYYWCARWI